MGLFNKRHSNEYTAAGQPVQGGGLNRPDGPINPPPQDTANPYISGNAALNGGYGGAVGPNAPYGAGGNNDGMMANNNNNNMLADHSGSHGRTWGAGAPNNGPLGSDRHHHTHGLNSTHTGPAPLVGVTSGTPQNNKLNSSHSPTNAARPTIREANKLDRKAKMESTMGGLLCNSSMKAKAHTHHAQADHLRMQASELGEAQRLETEAGMRRQRAVGLGADPTLATGMTGFAPGQTGQAVH